MVNSMVNSNVATIILAGNEIKVEFGRGHPYYQIINKGDTDIYASMSPNITPESDGVYTVSAGCSEIIGEGYPFAAFYLLGTGKAYIRGKQNAMPASFKLRGKGGDPSGGGLKIKIVTELPEVGNSEYLYLVPKDDLLSNNIYDEYLWVDGKWEPIGDTAIEVDLTDYAKKEDIPTIPVTVSDFSMEENYTSTGTQLHIGCRKNWSTGSYNVNEKFLVLNPATNTRAGLITAAEKKKLTSLLPPISEISDNPTGENVPTDLAVYNFVKNLNTISQAKNITDPKYDWNTITKSGTYTIGYNGNIIADSHGPLGVTGWGLLIVINTGLGNTNPACIRQIYEAGSGGLYTRNKWQINGEWSPWYVYYCETYAPAQNEEV